jgi:hypothetical protein
MGSSLFLSDRAAAFAAASTHDSAETRTSAAHAERKATRPFGMFPGDVWIIVS